MDLPSGSVLPKDERVSRTSSEEFVDRVLAMTRSEDDSTRRDAVRNIETMGKRLPDSR